MFQLIKLPASPNIITILEGYVKNFAVNILVGTGEKNRNVNQPIPPERKYGFHWFFTFFMKLYTVVYHHTHVNNYYMCMWPKCLEISRKLTF